MYRCGTAGKQMKIFSLSSSKSSRCRFLGQPLLGFRAIDLLSSKFFKQTFEVCLNWIYSTTESGNSSRSTDKNQLNTVKFHLLLYRFDSRTLLWILCKNVVNSKTHTSRKQSKRWNNNKSWKIYKLKSIRL